jgi:hypothetical protein
MACCSWCLKTATCRDGKLHFACEVHRANLKPIMQATAKDYDALHAVEARAQFRRDDYDLAR